MNISSINREGRPCDPKVIIDQIGRFNVLAISGGRVEQVVTENGKDVVGVNLPIRYGYSVVVFLDWDDTYVVQRVWRSEVKDEARGIYCDEVGEIAYRASCYRDGPIFAIGVAG